jgi:hypothetical protein
MIHEQICLTREKSKEVIGPLGHCFLSGRVRERVYSFLFVFTESLEVSMFLSIKVFKRI